MKKITKICVVFLFFAICQSSFAFEFKNPFKKKEPPLKPKMVETRQEWEIESQNIPLSERTIENKKEEIDEKKYFVPEPKYVFEKYNYPQGTREVNIEDIKKRLGMYPYLVADKDCKYAAYTYFYYSPHINQISSNFFVEKLDTNKSKIRRILEYNHAQEERIPVLESGVKEEYPNLYKAVTLVDWSNDSKKLLLKEKVGSLTGGIYKTYLYIYYLATDMEPAKTVKLEKLDRKIKYYYIDWEKKQIGKYRYDIIPLGFSADNDEIIIVLCYVYNKEGDKIFLGKWGYNIDTETALLFSKTEPASDTSVNGIILKQVLD